jgi:hypothetical protein
MKRFLGAGLLLVANLAWTQTVDWTRTAVTLDQLNAQILDWAGEYQRTAAPGGLDALNGVIALHFKRGPVVATGIGSLIDKWNTASETQRKSRYLAISRYFAIHTDDWGSSVAWAWYRCFSPPLDARYNEAADDAGQPTVPVSADLIPETADISPLLDIQLQVITAFLTSNGYPIVDTPITRFSFDRQGILLDGRPPRDRSLLNSKFTFTGTLIGLFGTGF